MPAPLADVFITCARADGTWRRRLGPTAAMGLLVWPQHTKAREASEPPGSRISRLEPHEYWLAAR